MLKFSEQNAKTANLALVGALQPYLAGGRKIFSLDLLSGVACPGAKDCHSFAKFNELTQKWGIQDGKYTQFRFASLPRKRYDPLPSGVAFPQFGNNQSGE